MRKSLQVSHRCLLKHTTLNPPDGLFGDLYLWILLIKKYSTDYIKYNWEKELDTHISTDEWSHIFHTQMSTTNLQSLRVLPKELHEVRYNPKNNIQTFWTTEPMLETVWQTKLIFLCFVLFCNLSGLKYMPPLRAY